MALRTQTKHLPAMQNKLNDIYYSTTDHINDNSTHKSNQLKRDRKSSKNNSMVLHSSIESTTGLTTDLNELSMKKLSIKFKNLYEELKVLKAKGIEINQKNQEIAMKIKEEFYNRNAYTEKYEEEMRALIALTDEIEKDIKENINKDLLLEERDLKNGTIMQLQDRIQALQEELKKHEVVIKLDGAKNYHIQNEQYKLERKEKELIAKIDLLTNDVNIKQDEVNGLKAEVSSLKDKESELNSEISPIIDEQLDKETKIKENIENYRIQLSKKSQIEQQLDESEKSMSKITQELQTRIHRFEVLLIANEGLERKLNSLKELQEVQPPGSIQELKQENLELKSKLCLPISDYSIMSQKNLGSTLSSINVNMMSTTGTKSASKLSTIANKKSSKTFVNTLKKDDNSANHLLRISLIAEIEKLKYKTKSERNHILELQNNSEENEEQIQTLSNEINVLQERLKSVDLDMERSHRFALEMKSNVQTKSILLQRMEDKYNKTIESVSELDKKSIIDTKFNESVMTNVDSKYESLDTVAKSSIKSPINSKNLLIQNFKK